MNDKFEIKTTIMKPTIKRIFLINLFALFALFSCNEEPFQEVQNNQEEVIAPNSSLANLMALTTSNDGSVDDILDGADCFSVNLPVTITAGNITITINTLDDLELLEDILDELDDEEVPEFLFPITITLNDFEQVIIENQEELEAFIDQCLEDDNEVIECVDFQYPISFSIYNTDFQIIDTVIIENDQELYEFLENLEEGVNGLVLASLNFPVTLVYANGDTIQVTSNQELESAISAAEDDCEEEDECEQEEVVLNLKDCLWYGSLNNDAFEGLQFDFMTENDLLITNSIGATLFSTWSVTETVDGLFLELSGLDSFGLEVLVGSWLIIECDDNRLELVKGDDVLVLEQDCDDSNNPFECFGNYALAACDQDDGIEDGFAIFDLNLIFSNCPSDDFEYYFYLTIADAEAQVNPLPSDFTNFTSPQTIYSRVYLVANPNDYEIFEHELIVEDCSEETCSEADIDAYLLECIWNAVSFNGDDNLIDYNMDFESSDVVVIYTDTETIDASWYTSETDDGIWLEFGNVNLGTIQAITGNWLVVECNEDRLELQKGDDTIVLEQNCE